MVNYMKTAVVYWSSTGNTEEMANLIADAVRAAGAQAELFTASDFNAELIKDFDSFAFGCPSMGVEELEESEFRPMFDEVKGSLAGKKVALFGSYGWGDGEWMRNWQEECEGLGITLVADGVIANEAPDSEAAQKCAELGNLLV